MQQIKCIQSSIADPNKEVLVLSALKEGFRLTSVVGWTSNGYPYFCFYLTKD